MLVDNMPLRRMIDFKPHAEDMAMLPLDVVLYLKVSVVSYAGETNYAFLRFLFSDPEIRDYFKGIEKTIVYDFDGRETKQERFVTILELYGLKNYAETSIYLKELMERYDHEADVLIDIYTHDDKEYRLSDLDGVVKLEEMDNKIVLTFDE